MIIKKTGFSHLSCQTHPVSASDDPFFLDPQGIEPILLNLGYERSGNALVIDPSIEPDEIVLEEISKECKQASSHLENLLNWKGSPHGQLVIRPVFCP